MGSAVREMTREELLCKLEKIKKDRDLRMIELADANAELEKIRYQMRNVNDVLFGVFGIKHAAARNPEDLKTDCQRAISEIKIERDKAVAQIELDRVKIGELLNEIDCKRMELPSKKPIEAAEWLIDAKSVYSVSDLREIAEHLLAYCNNENKRRQG